MTHQPEKMDLVIQSALNQAPAQRLSSNELNSKISLLPIAEQNLLYQGISETTRAVVENGLKSPIRSLFHLVSWPDHLREINRSVIEVLCAYTGADPEKTSDPVYTACTELMTKSFNDLSIGEIREAFRLVACREIDVDIAAYRGIASAAAFGEVMTKYREKRNKFVVALNSAVLAADARAKQDDEEKRAKAKAEYEEVVLKWYNKHRQNKGADLALKDVAWYYFDTLFQMKMVSPTKHERDKNKAEALIQIQKELREKQEKRMDISPEEKRILASISDVGIHATIESLDGPYTVHVQNLAKRLFLFNQIKTGG